MQINLNYKLAPRRLWRGKGMVCDIASFVVITDHGAAGSQTRQVLVWTWNEAHANDFCDGRFSYALHAAIASVSMARYHSLCNWQIQCVVEPVS